MSKHCTLDPYSISLVFLLIFPQNSSSQQIHWESIDIDKQKKLWIFSKYFKLWEKFFDWVPFSAFRFFCIGKWNEKDSYYKQNPFLIQSNEAESSRVEAEKKKKKKKKWIMRSGCRAHKWFSMAVKVAINLFNIVWQFHPMSKSNGIRSIKFIKLILDKFSKWIGMRVVLSGASKKTNRKKSATYEWQNKVIINMNRTDTTARNVENKL